MVNTVKFSDFTEADINDSSTENVGLSSGVNTRELKFYTWTSAGRPLTPFNGLLGLNTTLQQYEWWDAVTGMWTQFSDTNILPLLASHLVNEGASLIGLQDQSNVTSKTVQDFANANLIAQTDNGTLQNGFYLGSLTTGIVKNTTATGVLSISAPLTSIDSLTTALGDTLYISAPNIYTNLPGNITSGKQYLSQTGTGAVSAAPAWSTISGGDITGAALTKTDDTNVTLTLGGTPATALLRATSLTLGWTGTLSPTRGGLGLSNPTAHGILIGEGASAVTPIVLSSGQLLIGSTGIDPVAAAINSGTGILVGNGAGSITVQLANASNNTIKSNISGISAAPIDNTLTAIIDSAIGNTQGDILYRNATSWVVLAPSTAGFLLQTGGAAANPSWVAQAAPSSAALTKTDDTNVTLTLGGSPNTALLQATSLTLGWTGQLGVARGGTANSTFTAYSVICAGTTATGAFQNVSGVGTSGQVLQSNGAAALPTWATIPGSTSAALTEVNDTNVTLTLGGAPTTALLTATSITAGWTGQLSLTRGGSGASLTASNGGIVYSTASAMAILSGTATAGLALLSGASGAPTWSTSAPITQIAIQKFTTTGTYTPTSGMKYCIIECVGGGAAGGSSAQSAAPSMNAAGGGGAGSYSRKVSTAASIGSSQTATIGAGGTPGAAGTNAGGNGGDTSIGSICIGKGGSGGAGAGSGGQSSGGAGGVAGTGDLTVVGNPGQPGGGGNVVTFIMPSGAGGSSIYGAGGNSGISPGYTGNAGNSYGSGGSGGFSFANSAAVQGGAGAPGIIIITEFISA